MVLDQTTKTKTRTAATEEDTRAKADMAIFRRFETYTGPKLGWVPMLEVYQEQLRLLWLTTAGGPLDMTFGGYDYEIILFPMVEPVADGSVVGSQRNKKFDERSREVRIIQAPPTTAD